MQRLNAAMNAHDIEAFLACFRDDYRSEQPAHPDRAFHGREQVRTNWSAVFKGVADFRSELVRVAVDGEIAWSEWRWRVPAAVAYRSHPGIAGTRGSCKHHVAPRQRRGTIAYRAKKSR